MIGVYLLFQVFYLKSKLIVFLLLCLSYFLNSLCSIFLLAAYFAMNLSQLSFLLFHCHVSLEDAHYAELVQVAGAEIIREVPDLLQEFLINGVLSNSRPDFF